QNDVTEVGDYQFSGFNHITSVNISSYVTQMGFGTFSGCESIISLTIPFLGTTLNDEENTYLGYLFGATTPQDNYRFVPHSLKEVTLLGGESIYEASFYGCNFITNISIPMGVTSIGKEAFYNDRGLVDINIPKTVEEIDLDAFYECENLLNVYYEGTLEDWCSIQFKSASTNPMYYALHFYVKDNEGVWEEVTSIVLPDTIEQIGNYQFYGFSSVSSICLSESVLSIGISAFKGCEQLESFVVPFIGDSIDSLSNTHFGYLFGANNYNEHLTTIPTSLKDVTILHGGSISNNAFANCNYIKKIILPTEANTIGTSVLANCGNLESITIPFLGSNAFDETNYLGYLFGATSSSDNSRRVPSSLKEVIVVGGNVVSSSAFSGCSSITSIAILNSIETIGASAFKNCSNLKNITLGDHIRTIETNAFDSCTALVNVYYEGTIEDWCQIEFKSIVTNPMQYASNFYLRNDELEWEVVTDIVIPNT
ncbi:MAG: leucine-rich repeat domain-containing protein, partial [Anaeroplasmataceae bacterium]|nr:leucine-rich repeat domain-containing protein [Anaeroplasmataceae bacterium]